MGVHKVLRGRDRVDRSTFIMMEVSETLLIQFFNLKLHLKFYTLICYLSKVLICILAAHEYMLPHESVIFYK